MFKHILTVAFAASLPNVAASAELVTPSFHVVVTENCPEGEVTCQDVSYTGTSKKTGKAIKLNGKALAHMCPDGITPCHHVGYEFKNGAYVYFVGDNGNLRVTRKGKIIVNEMGKWAF